MENLGNRVTVRFHADSAMDGKTEVYRNVTEIHWLYPAVFGQRRVAFESAVHLTGITWDADSIAEFSTAPENEEAGGF